MCARVDFGNKFLEFFLNNKYAIISDENKKNIKENGLQEAIWLYDNRIVDGRNRLRVAGTSEFSGYDTLLNESRARIILNQSKAQFLNVGDFDNATFWAGLRPLTPDGMPVIGRTSIKKPLPEYWTRNPWMDDVCWLWKSDI